MLLEPRRSTQVNTNAVVYVNKAMNNVEGGWPKEVDYTEAEQVIRYKKKVRRVGRQGPACGRSAEPPAPWLPHNKRLEARQRAPPGLLDLRRRSRRTRTTSAPYRSWAAWRRS